MVFERSLLIFWVVVFGVALFISACTFKAIEDDLYKDNALVEEKKDVEFQISETTLDKEIQRWMLP